MVPEVDCRPMDGTASEGQVGRAAHGREQGAVSEGPGEETQVGLEAQTNEPECRVSKGRKDKQVQDD